MVGSRDHSTLIVDLVVEQLVRDRVDEGFSEVRVTDVDAFADYRLCNLFACHAVVRVVDLDDHRLLARIGLEHVDAVEPESASVRDRVERGEAGDGIFAEKDTREETLDEGETSFESRQVVRFEAGMIVNEIWEEPGKRSRVGLVEGFVVLEAPAVSERVASVLVRCQLGSAGCHRFQKAFFVDERNLDDRFPVLFLAVEILCKVCRVEIDNR